MANRKVDWSPEFVSEIKEVLKEIEKGEAEPIFLYGSSKVDALFITDRAKQFATNKFKEGPINILPGLRSDDPLMLEVKSRLANEWTETFPSSVDDLGRTYGNAVRGNFHNIRHVNGYRMIPATIPPYSNRLLREKEGLANEYVKPWHEKLFRSIVRHAFRGIEAVPVKWRRGTITAVPLFSSDDNVKEKLIREAFRDAKAAGNLMLQGNYEDAYLTYSVGGAYYIVYRAQSTDKVTEGEDGSFIFKDREVTDLMFAATNGEKGSRKPSSKSLDGIVDMNGNPMRDDFARERKRTANAVPAKISYCLMPIAQAVRLHMYEKFPMSFHSRGMSDQERVFSEWDHTIGADVSDHDILWFTFILDTVADELLQLGYADWWVELLITSMRLPLYLSAPGPGQGGILIGDWANPKLESGLPSGNPFTDLFGMIGMAPNYLITQIEHTAPEYISMLERAGPDEVDAFTGDYWRGELDFGCVSKGDDAQMVFRGPDRVKKAEELHAKMKSIKEGEGSATDINPYIKISYEHGFAYLGKLFWYDSTRELRNVRLIGDILSCARNLYSPEYTAPDPQDDRSRFKRPYPGIGWGTLKENYSGSPILGEFLDINEKVFRDVYGFSYNTMREQLLYEDERLLSLNMRKQGHDALAGGLGWATSIEREVIESPDKLSYKYTDLDVRSEVVEMFAREVNDSSVLEYVKSVAGSNCIGPHKNLNVN